MVKPATAVRKARFALTQAVQRMAYWRGEAQWKNGYRCGRSGQLSLVDEAKYQKQEADLWRRVDVEMAGVTRAMTHYARALRAQAVAKDSAARRVDTKKRRSE